MNYEERRKALLDKIARPDLLNSEGHDMYGNTAMALLLTGRCIEEADNSIRRVSEWFERPHPWGRKHNGECDFAAMKMMRLTWLKDLRERLTPGTRESVKRFFLTRDFASMHKSENHMFLFRTSRYLAACAMPGEKFESYGAVGAELIGEDREWLEKFMRYRARFGWGEFDSPCYMQPDFECLLNLYDFAPDEKLRELSGMMLNCMLADMLVDSLEGMYCGAHGRIYSRHAMDHFCENSRQLFCLYFDIIGPSEVPDKVMIDVLTSGFRPHPVIETLAGNRKKPLRTGNASIFIILLIFFRKLQ